MFALERRPSNETEVPYVTGISLRIPADPFARLSVFPLHCLKKFRKTPGTRRGERTARVARRPDVTDTEGKGQELARTRAD